MEPDHHTTANLARMRSRAWPDITALMMEMAGALPAQQQHCYEDGDGGRKARAKAAHVGQREGCPEIAGHAKQMMVVWRTTPAQTPAL